MLSASVTRKVTLGIGRLKPALRSRAIAHAVSMRPDRTRTTQAMTSHLNGGRLVRAGYDAHSSGMSARAASVPRLATPAVAGHNIGDECTHRPPSLLR